MGGHATRPRRTGARRACARSPPGGPRQRAGCGRGRADLVQHGAQQPQPRHAPGPPGGPTCPALTWHAVAGMRGPAGWPDAGLRGGVAAGKIARVGQGPLADLVGLGGRDAEHAEQVLGDLVGGLGAVAVRLVVQQLARHSWAPATMARARSGSRMVSRPARAAASMSRRARATSPVSEPSTAGPLLSRTRLSSGWARCSRPVSRKPCAKT